MAFPASTQRLDDALVKINNLANSLKTQVLSVRNRSAGAPVSRQEILNLHLIIQNTLDAWQAIAAAVNTADLVARAKEEYGDPALDIQAEYSAMRTAAIALRDYIYGFIPTDAGSGQPLLYTWNSDATKSLIEESSASTSDFRNNCDALIVTIG